MQIPVLQQGPFLIASILGAVSDTDLLGLRDELVNKVGSVNCRGVVIDVSALELMDSFATRTLADMASMLRLRGAETVIVGIQPTIALAMVRLGLRLPHVPTALDLEEGLAYLNALLRRERDVGD